jgi:hypothetical protein
MNKPLSQKQSDAFEKSFLYMDIANQFLYLVYSDLRRDDPILNGENGRKSGELIDCIACLMDDAKELITNAAYGGNHDHNS